MFCKLLKNAGKRTEYRSLLCFCHYKMHKTCFDCHSLHCLRIFHAYRGLTINIEELNDLVFCTKSKRSKSPFDVLLLLSSNKPLMCHICYDMEPRYLWFHLKDCMQSRFTRGTFEHILNVTKMMISSVLAT